ncbi:MAG: hypothetical protein Q4D04_12165 [Clostridia bacterium]|nr:hypothetical protein [Clostridia bacterium]
MWQRFISWVKRLFGKAAVKVPDLDRFARQYEDITGENITATICNKLAALTLGDSTLEVNGGGRRAALIGEALDGVWRDAGWITAQALGKGGKVLVPVVAQGGVTVSVIDQDRLFVTEMRGRRMTSATVLADAAVIEDRTYYRWMDYTMDEKGNQFIRSRATNEMGGEVPLGVAPAWADIAAEVGVGATDRLLLAVVRCPRDNRRGDRLYGVPATYGAEREIEEIVEHLNVYRREYRLSRMMLGLDSTLWAAKGDFSTLTATTIDQVRRTVQDSDDPFIPSPKASLNDKSGWDVYAPAIRYEAMEARLQSLYRRLEKACGLSQGILTERQQQNYSNRDEVRAAMYDTYSVIRGMRDAWEDALDDLAYAVDVLAERFALTPAGARGQYEIAVDWDTSMIESSAESFAQLSELQSRGMVSKAELRQWVRGGTLEEAKRAVDEIAGEMDALAELMPGGGDDDGDGAEDEEDKGGDS